MARWHSCNILQVGGDTRRVWQFDARKAELTLGREQAVNAGQSLPANLVNKTWTSLWQPKLNVAWLSAENVFLRVVHLPKADLTETRAMVEFQLEKLSPIPVTQMVWSIHILPARAEVKVAAPVEGEKKKEDLQTVIIVMVARAAVEEFLGKLEKDGFLADRLEVPLLDQLQHTAIVGDGAWIYLDGGKTTALVAWWFGGELKSLGLVFLPADKNSTALRDQLVQMTWAGELEGWLAGTPKWHLVVTGALAAEWQAGFNAALEAPVKLVEPPGVAQLAAATAKRATHSDDSANILPVEYSKRYHQQFVDRLWMRGLMATLAVYGVVVLVYFVALGFLNHQAGGVEQQVADLKDDFTRSQQLKDRYRVLKDRQVLKFAALDCWKTSAELLPSGATLNGLDFRDGKKLTLTGTAGSDQASDVIDFNSAIRKAEVNGAPLFSRVDSPTYNQNPANNTVTWSFSCDLNHAEDAP